MSNERPRGLLLVVSSPSGAGKTTVAREVADSVGEAVTRIPIDNYYHDLSHLEMAEREDVNYDHPDAFDWPLVREQVSALCEGRAVEMPQYDFAVHDRTGETVRVEPGEVVIVEGILALYDDVLGEMLDLKIYVETDADVADARRRECRSDLKLRGFQGSGRP